MSATKTQHKPKFSLGQVVIHVGGVIPYVITGVHEMSNGTRFYTCLTGGSDSGSPVYEESSLRRLSARERGEAR